MKTPLLLLAAFLVACPLAAQQPDVASPAPAAQPAAELTSTYKLEFELTGPDKESLSASLASSSARFGLNSSIRIEGDLAELSDGRLRLHTLANFPGRDTSSGSFSSKSHPSQPLGLTSTVIVRPGQKLELLKNERHTLSVTITRVE